MLAIKRYMAIHIREEEEDRERDITDGDMR